MREILHYFPHFLVLYYFLCDRQIFLFYDFPNFFCWMQKKIIIIFKFLGYKFGRAVKRCRLNNRPHFFNRCGEKNNRQIAVKT